MQEVGGGSSKCVAGKCLIINETVQVKKKERKKMCSVVS